VEEEELEEALEKKDDLDGLLAGGASSQKRLRKGSASDSSDMEGEESNGSEEGQLRWTHMSVRRMLQEVKKRANTSDGGIVTMMSIASDGVKRKKEEQDELLVLLDDLIYALNRLPEQYKVNNYSQLLYQMEQDYQRRRIYLSFLCTEKIEMLQSYEHLRSEVERLVEEKEIYSEYLKNVQLKAFLARIKSRPIIGPFKYKIRDLIKAGVIMPPGGELADGLLGGVEIRATTERGGGGSRTWADGVVKMSCTSPGSINLVIHHTDSAPHFYEMQLSKLMDELLTNDTITYNGVTFDLRKVIHFINKNLTG